MIRNLTDDTFPITSLRGDGVVLRPLTGADAPLIATYCTDEQIQRWLPLPNPYTLTDARWFCLEFAPSQRESGRGVVFGIELAGRLAGVIDLKRTDWRARTTEIGYWAAPWARGQGVIRRAVSQLSRWALDDLGFARLEIRVATDNRDSQRVAEAAGFTREGILRNAGFVHAGRVDLVLYSLVDSDTRNAGD
jgi:RimJ/RimL family protein N-acetyltransferase